MKIALASAIVCSFVATGIGQQAVSLRTAGQTTTPANQGVASNPTGGSQGGATNSPIGTIPTNATAGPTLLELVTNSAPVVLNVMPRLVTDTNGLALGTLVQLSLSRAGMVNFGLVDVGGQLVSMPWNLIVSGLSTNGATNIQDVVQRPPPVLMGSGSFPPAMEEDFQNRVLSYVAEQIPPRPPVNRSTAQGGSGGAGVTITGGNTNVVSFTTNFAPMATNTARTTNYGSGNSATNTTNGVPSPTGSTNAVHIPPLPGRQQR